MQSKKKWFVVFILLAALAGAAFYFLYFIRTPAYALNEARVGRQQHDSAKISRYVDVPSVMDNAFEDIIKAEETRQRVIAAFEMLYTKSEDRPSKKHGTV